MSTNSNSNNRTPRRQSWSVAIRVCAVAVALAGCGPEEVGTTRASAANAAPGVTDVQPTTTTPSTTATPEMSTVDVATTTAAPTTTTEPPTTTTEPPMATPAAPTTSTSTTTSTPQPATAAATVLIGGSGEFPWPVLGWWDGSAWVDDVASAAVPAAEGDTVEVVTLDGLDGPDGTVTLGAQTALDDEACPSPAFPVAVDVPAADPPGYGYSAVAVSAPWNVGPRPVVEAGLDVPEYHEIGEDLAASLGVDGAHGDVAQVVRVDLTGDGFEEVVVVFEYVQPSIRGAAGDVSLVYLRTLTADGTVTEQIVASSTVSADDELPDLTQYRVVGAADLNHDGVMELLLREWYWEGAGVTAWEITDGTLARILAYRCGS